MAQKLALYYVSEEKTDGVLSEERKQKLGGLWSRIHGRDGFARGYEFPWKSTLKFQGKKKDLESALEKTFNKAIKKSQQIGAEKMKAIMGDMNFPGLGGGN